jgi:hypothetical protein
MTRFLFGPLGPAPLLAWLSILLGLAVICVPGISIALLSSKLTRSRFNPCQIPILGLAGAVWYAEVWSLFRKVDAQCLFSLIVISTCLSLWLIRYGRADLQGATRPKTRYLFLLVSFSFLVAINAGSRMNSGDSGIYHLNAIRWIQESGCPPGIANVHTRLGFNCSLFVVVALLNGVLHAAQVSNGIVIMACTIYLYGLLCEINFNFRHRAFLFLAAAFGGLVLPALSVFASSPSPDVSQSALAIFTLVAGSQYFLLEKGEAELSNSILVLILVASLHVKFKASGIVLAVGMAVCVGLTLAYQSKKRYARFKALAFGAALFPLLVIPWVIRGYITSGYPLFPSLLLGAPVDWRVPEILANDEAAWVYSWARNPGSDWRIVLADTQWFGPWWNRNATDPKNQDIFVFWLISLGILASAMRMSLASGSAGKYPSAWKLACFIPSLTAVLFWLRTAPDPRFANGLLWSFGLALLLLATPSGTLSKKRSINDLILIAVPIVSLMLVELNRMAHEKYLFPARYRQITLKELTSHYGVRVLVPATGDQVGDSPVPAAPENRFQPNLQYRGRTPEDGFRINGEAIIR